MKICIICSGVSDEKGISINSTKSIYEILEYYKNYIDQINILLMTEELKFFLLKKEFLFANTIEDFLYLCEQKDIIYNYVEYLKRFDVVFLTTHGTYGEDGSLQKVLEENNINYIGPSYLCASKTFYKSTALEFIWNNDICKPWTSEIYTNHEQVTKLINQHKRLCIKPNDGGSSIGVSICNSYEEALQSIEDLKKQNYIPLLEEVHEGKEFSITVIKGHVYEPTEIINEGIFTYEKKYFPSNEVSYRYPAKFPLKILEKIKEDTKKIYNLFQCKDCMRLDGFYLNNKELIYTDLNTIPGFQLNGLFFKNKSHFELLGRILNLPSQNNHSKKERKKIFLIFGGDSSEQNISIISGGNVLFNLSKDSNYDIQPFLLKQNKMWPVNYEESFQNSIKDFAYILKKKTPLSLNEFVNKCKEDKAIVFMGLHGGIGENGSLQKIFEHNNIPYTGSNSQISKLCMNKYKTNRFIEKHLSHHPNVYIIKQILIKNLHLLTILEIKDIWPQWRKVFIKPNDDGCSVGAILLSSIDEFIKYHHAVVNKVKNFADIMMSLKSKDYLLSEYIEVDKVRAIQNIITYLPQTYWIEGTVGVVGNTIMSPSLCITENNLLTMEEKFLHGVGTNLTPIPDKIMINKHNKIIQKVIKLLIKHIKLNTYCRVDFFYNIKMKKVAIIEINTLPALTPATVLFQQAIYKGLTPRLFIEKILKLAYINNKKLYLGV